MGIAKNQSQNIQLSLAHNQQLVLVVLVALAVLVALVAHHFNQLPNPNQLAHTNHLPKALLNHLAHRHLVY